MALGWRAATLPLATAFALTVSTAPGQETAARGILEGHGVVKAVAPRADALTLSHDEIKGFMPAMEMMYRVRSPELVKNLKPGDVIDFKIDAEKYTIVEVKRVTPTK
jgi:Cu/Ag efflux protein CusF